MFCFLLRYKVVYRLLIMMILYNVGFEFNINICICIKYLMFFDNIIIDVFLII